MNLLLLFPEDFVTETRVKVIGRRRDEIARIGGDALRVGVINGRCGTGKIIGPGRASSTCISTAIRHRPSR